MVYDWEAKYIERFGVVPTKEQLANYVSIFILREDPDMRIQKIWTKLTPIQQQIWIMDQMKK